MHYESLHPVHRQDIEETIKLTNAYIAKPTRYKEIYGFTRDDIQCLVSSTASKPIKETEKTQETEFKSTKQIVIDSQEENDSNKRHEPHKKEKGDRFLFVQGSIEFEELDDGKIQCGGCKEKISRIVGHLTKSIDCTQNIDLEEFKSKWTKFTQKKRNANCYQN